jgi:hypothetical protein
MSLICAHCRAAVPATPPNGVCPQCGKPWQAAPVLEAEPVGAGPARLSKLAVASLLCAFLICLPILNAGLALGLGIGALASIAGSQGQLKGRGIAIAGIVLGCFSVVALLPLLVVVGPALTRYLSHARIEEIRGQVQQLGQRELDYYQAHGQFLRVPPMPLLRPARPSRIEPSEATLALGWVPPDVSRYQFEVDVDGIGPDARARVTADLGAAGAMGGPPPHEEVLVTPNGLGTVTEVPTPLH